MTTQYAQLEALMAALIDLGAGGVNCLDSTKNEAGLMGALINRGLEPLAGKLPEDNLKRLIRGLVLFEKIIDKSASGYVLGGSVSPVVFLWQMYVTKYPNKEADLTAWVVTHRVNPYEPFGSIVFNDCMSISSRENALRQLEEEKLARRVIEEKKQQKVREVKKEKDRLNANNNLPNAVIRGDIKAVKALLGKGGDVSIRGANGKSLLELAEQNNRKEIIGYLNHMLAK